MMPVLKKIIKIKYTKERYQRICMHLKQKQYVKHIGPPVLAKLFVVFLTADLITYSGIICGTISSKLLLLLFLTISFIVNGVSRQ